MGVDSFDLLFICLRSPFWCSPKLGFRHELLRYSMPLLIIYERVALILFISCKIFLFHVMFYWLIYLYLWSNVLDLHNVLVVFVVGSPFWRYLIFISFKPLRSIYIKHLYSIIFNIRALVCLISCLFAYWMKFVSIQIDINRGGRFVPPLVFPSIFDSKRLL